MERKFKRGYIEKGWDNPITYRRIPNEYSITITKVIQTDDYGKWEDEDEDEIEQVGGFKTRQEAIDELIKNGCKEILDSDNGYRVIYTKLK